MDNMISLHGVPTPPADNAGSGTLKKRTPPPKKRRGKELERIHMREIVADIRRYQRMINEKLVLLASLLKNNRNVPFDRELITTDINLVWRLAKNIGDIRNDGGGFLSGEAREELEILLKEQEQLIGRASSNVVTGERAAEVRRGLLAAQYRLGEFMKKIGTKHPFRHRLKHHLRMLESFALQCEAY